jgi:hypothetical protein
MRRLIVAMVAVLAVGCSNAPDRPLVDGYTLQGVVLDADTMAPVESANILVGLEPNPEFRLFGVTDVNGGFTFQPSIETAPNSEIFRFQKAGYAALDVAARTATRVEEYRYRLEVILQPEPSQRQRLTP